MSLTTNPWILKYMHKSSVYTLPFEFVNTQKHSVPSYNKPSFNRPAILMFSSKNSADSFRDKMLFPLLYNNIDMSWNVLGNYTNSDIDGFAEVDLSLKIKGTTNKNLDDSVSIHDIISTELARVDNTTLMSLTLCSYAIYFYVDFIKYNQLLRTIQMKGFLIDPHGAIHHYNQNQQDEYFTKDLVVSYLNDQLIK